MRYSTVQSFKLRGNFCKQCFNFQSFKIRGIRLDFDLYINRLLIGFKQIFLNAKRSMASFSINNWLTINRLALQWLPRAMPNSESSSTSWRPAGPGSAMTTSPMNGEGEYTTRSWRLCPGYCKESSVKWALGRFPLPPQWGLPATVLCKHWCWFSG